MAYVPSGEYGIYTQAKSLYQPYVPSGEYSIYTQAPEGTYKPGPAYVPPVTTASDPAPSGNPDNNQQSGAPATYATGVTRTQRRVGGWVDVLQQMSDGSWQVVDSYQDFSARDSALAMFRAAGLDDAFVNSLMASIDGVYATNIMPTDAQILSAIYNSDAYKKRFAANETIRKRLADGSGRPGDRLLTPKEYIDLENSYRQVMQDAGMPTGFYDQQEDFTNMIANGVSVAEMKSRVDTAYQALNFADENVKNTLREYYGMSTGDMVAYLLDPTRATPLLMGKSTMNEYGLNDRTSLQKAYASADLGGTARRLGQEDSQSMNEEIVNLGVSTEVAKNQFGKAAGQADDVRRLGAIYGDSGMGFSSIIREDLGLTGGSEAGRKRKKFASKERASFAGQSAIDRNSLRRRSDV